MHGALPEYSLLRAACVQDALSLFALVLCCGWVILGVLVA